jgi:hypothetical protein
MLEKHKLRLEQKSQVSSLILSHPALYPYKQKALSRILNEMIIDSREKNATPTCNPSVFD